MVHRGQSSALLRCLHFSRRCWCWPPVLRGKCCSASPRSHQFTPPNSRETPPWFSPCNELFWWQRLSLFIQSKPWKAPQHLKRSGWWIGENVTDCGRSCPALGVKGRGEAEADLCVLLGCDSSGYWKDGEKTRKVAGFVQQIHRKYVIYILI